MSLELRLVAYQPDGDRMGILPDVISADVTDTANDVSSLVMAYPADGRNVAWLANPIEVAVEYRNGSGWVENRNCRFMNLQEEGDFVAEAKVQNFTMPGYAWNLSRAQIEVPALLRSRTGKRSFRDVTPGRLIQALVLEAQARGTLSGMSLGFNASQTATGSAWLNTAIGLEFEPATDILAALRSLTDTGMVDWYMQGRQLVMANSSSDITFNRFGQLPVTFETEVNILEWASTLGSALNDSNDKIFGAPNARMVSGKDVERIVINAGVAAKAFASRQHPIDPYLVGQNWVTGTDPSRTPARRVALMRHRDPDVVDGNDVYFGSAAFDWSNPTSNLVCVYETNQTLANLAMGTFLDTNGTAVVINDSEPETKANSDIRSGYMRRCAVLMDAKLATVEIGTFESAEELPVDVVLQLGAADPGPLGFELRDRLIAAGVRVRFDYGTSSLRTTVYDNTPPPAATGPQMRILPRKDSYYEASIAWDGNFWGGVKPADFSHVEVHRSSAGADFTPTEDTIQPGNLTKAGVRLVELRKSTAQWWKFVVVDQNRNKSRPSACGIVSRGDKPGETNMQNASKLPPFPGQEPTIVRKPMPVDLTQAKMILAERAARQSSRFVRMKVSSDAQDNASTMNKIRTALAGTLATLRPTNPKIQWGAAKETLPGDPELGEEIAPKIGAISLLAGRDLTEAPYTHTLTNVVSRVFAYGEAWLQTTLTNQDNKLTPWGDWEVGMAAGGVQDEKDLQIAAFAMLEAGSGPKQSYTRGIVFEAARWLPMKDYDAGDIILSYDRTGEVVAMKISTITVSLTPDGYTGSITLNDRIVPPELKSAAQVRAAAGGSVGGVTTGGSGTRPIAPAGTDARKPRPTFML